MNTNIDNKTKLTESLNELKKSMKYYEENKEEILKKKREEYKKSQMELIQNGIEEIKNLKEKNKLDEKDVLDKDIIKSTIFMIKLIRILSKLHDDDYEEKTMLIMVYIQLSLSLDDKTDLEYTELLEKIFFESLFDKSFIVKMPNYLKNEKISYCFEKLLEYLKL